MVNINCTKAGHNENLSKLCEDEECNEQTEQFDMECAGCEEQNMHQKKNHATKRVKTVLSEVISSTYEEEENQKKK